MRCHRIQSQFLAFMDGDLTPRQQSRVTTHLAACSACVLVLRDMQQTLRLVQAFDAPEPSQHFWEHFAPALSQRTRRTVVDRPSWLRTRFQPLWHVPRPALAALAISILLITLLPPLRGYVRQHVPPSLGLSVGEEASANTELDFLKYLDLLEEVELLEQMDPGD